MKPIEALQKHGQSIWLDFISRSLLSGGELKRLVDEGITGVTSNPSIFQKSICETHDYDDIVQAVQKNKSPDIPGIYEKMAVDDIQKAADVLRPVYDSTGGSDGFVSFEVSPHLACATAETVSEAERLWKLVNRPNLMIKVPATKEGIPAVEILTARGINVNATLIFNINHYGAVAMAYIRGLEKNSNPKQVASVASFFVSRIDTAVDKLLDKNGSPAALNLRGKIAVASAKMVYRRFSEIFYESPFAAQRNRGAKVQRLVWGSTGAKNPRYSDVLYVDEIIGPDTINTVPMPTLNAFLDHGQARQSLLEDVGVAEKQIAGLKKFGVDLEAVTEQLQKEGVQSFIQAFDQLLESLRGRCSLGG
jgi:transaldolase